MSNQLYGWRGRILRIDLTHGNSRVETLPEDLRERFLGGRGLAGALIRDRITLPWNDPDMPLCFLTGPLVGTASPTSGRMAVASRSPLTGTVGDASVGGRLGTALKRAGWDGLVVTGKSDVPCGIEIDGDAVSIVGAKDLRGMETDLLGEKLAGKGATAVVGPAAENGVFFAGIVIDGHYVAARGGLGLVMAGKGWKYLAVRGRGTVPVYDLPGLKAAGEDVLRLVAASPVLLGPFGLTHYGTPALYDLIHARRMTPTDNFRRTWFPGAPGLNAWHLRRRYDAKGSGCAGCSIRCKRLSADGQSLPEYETLSHFTALLGNGDLATAVAAHRRCNALGMDAISAAATLACHAEMTGRDLAPDEILCLLEEIGFGRGVGRELGRGATTYARGRGRPDAAMTVKGQELPAYDPRGACGMALAYATSTRGGCHLRAYPISHEILRKPVATDRFTFEGKARIVKIAEDTNAVVDSLTACRFVFFAATLEEYARVFTAVTGRPATAQDLLRIGERICYDERVMNAANGFAAPDDDLPARFFEEPGTGGNGVAVPPLDRGEFLAARRRYYAIRGLDAQGRPLKERSGESALSERQPTVPERNHPWNVA